MEPDLQALYMVTLTLTRTATGGLYDQLGGGFFRYSVDQCWTIPHFEKMLYDNTSLLAVYSDGYAATGEALFGRVASETAELTCPCSTKRSSTSRLTKSGRLA